MTWLVPPRTKASEYGATGSDTEYDENARSPE
jgi:hypothetical protein